MKPETATTSRAEDRLSLNNPHQTTVICDLAEADGFVESHGKPHVPVMSAFGAGQLHICRLTGAWDLDLMVKDHGGVMFRSIRKLNSNKTMEIWDDLTFQFGPRSFLYADATRIVGFATTPAEASSLVKKTSEVYRKILAPAVAGGEYNLIQMEPREIKCHKITLPPNTLLTTETLNTHYGTGSEAWHESLLKKLRNKDRGLCIFEGVPGTGKTFYLRHLMAVLKETHRFYFVPTTSLAFLSRAEFVGFWVDQRRQYSEQQLVVVLEDSDAALMTRGVDNREQVSAILNLTDGLLADFLRLQIICTINCTASDIDPALLRPGRLICHRVFGRLEYADALRLAESLGRKLPVAGDYSLAEVFAGHDQYQRKRPAIGFAA